MAESRGRGRARPPPWRVCRSPPVREERGLVGWRERTHSPHVRQYQVDATLALLLGKNVLQWRFGPVVHDSIRLGTQNVFSKLMDLSDTALQV